MAVEEAAVDAGLKVEDAAGVPFGEHDIVERQLARRLAVGREDAGIEQRPLVDTAAALQSGIEAVEHVLRHDIGEKAQPAAVDAQQRYARLGHQPGGIEQRAVTADDDSQLRPLE